MSTKVLIIVTIVQPLCGKVILWLYNHSQLLHSSLVQAIWLFPAQIFIDVMIYWSLWLVWSYETEMAHFVYSGMYLCVPQLEFGVVFFPEDIDTYPLQPV